MVMCLCRTSQIWTADRDQNMHTSYWSDAEEEVSPRDGLCVCSNK